MIIAVFLGIEIHGLLIGQSAAPEARQAISDWLAARGEIAQLYNVITFQMGSYLFVAVKARMHEAESASRLVAEINSVQDALKLAFPNVRWVFFEPDEKD